MQLQENAQKVQKRLINKPRRSVQVAADIVEQVLRTGGEPYLETMQHQLSWWQLSLVDVKLFLVSVASVVVGLVVLALTAVSRCVMRRIQAMQMYNRSKSKAA